MAAEREPPHSGPGPFLAVARVVAAHGVRGDLRCQVITDFPERFHSTRQVYLGEEHRPAQVQRARIEPRRLLLKLAGVDTREAAQALVGRFIYVPQAEAVRLPPGSYFWHQIIGLRVETVEGVELGTVTEILETGSNHVYVVRGRGREVLVPAIAEVVRAVELERGVLTIAPLEGML